jgi:hypothetical protein
MMSWSVPNFLDLQEPAVASPPWRLMAASVPGESPSCIRPWRKRRPHSGAVRNLFAVDWSRYIITRIGTVQLENDRTMIIKMNPPIPRRPTPMSLAIHRTRSSSSGRSGCARFAHRTMTTGRRMANTAPTNISIGNMASAICLKKTSSITQVTPRVAHPCVLCKGGIPECDHYRILILIFPSQRLGLRIE